MGQCADLQLNLSILQPRFGVVTMVPITNQSAPPKSSPPSSASPINTQCSTGRHRQHLTFLPHFLTHCTGCVHSCCSKPQPTNLWSVPAPLHPKCYLTGSGRILAYQSLMKKLSAPAQIWRTSAREASPPNSTSNTSLSIELPYPEQNYALIKTPNLNLTPPKSQRLWKEKSRKKVMTLHFGERK